MREREREKKKRKKKTRYKKIKRTFYVFGSNKDRNNNHSFLNS